MLVDKVNVLHGFVNVIVGYIYLQSHTHAHKHTRTHTHTNIHTHTHIFIYIYTRHSIILPYYLMYPEIIDLVKTSQSPLYRPRVGDATCPSYMVALMEKCWQEVADDRPTFADVKSDLKAANNNKLVKNLIFSCYLKFHHFVEIKSHNISSC